MAHTQREVAREVAQRGREIEARVLAEARRVAEAYGVAEGSEEYAQALQGAMDSLDEADAEALAQYWDTQSEQREAEEGTQNPPQSEVERGARICVAYWEAQGDAEMLADAQARLGRVLEGTANRVDIEGAMDWLDYEGEEDEQEDTDMGDRDRRLLAVLQDHTCKNAREVAHDIWKNGDEEGIYEALLEAIERCENGEGTDADWDMLVDQTCM